jgi:hypothetical protein
VHRGKGIRRRRRRWIPFLGRKGHLLSLSCSTLDGWGLDPWVRAGIASAGTRTGAGKCGGVALSMTEDQSLTKLIAERNSIGSHALARMAVDDRCGPRARVILGSRARVPRTPCQVREDTRRMRSNGNIPAATRRDGLGGVARRLRSRRRALLLADDTRLPAEPRSGTCRGLADDLGPTVSSISARTAVEAAARARTPD